MLRFKKILNEIENYVKRVRAVTVTVTLVSYSDRYDKPVELI